MKRVAQRGVALLVVLWACTLLAIMVGGYAALARTESVQARYSATQANLRYAAEAGVMRAIHDVYLQRRNDDITEGSARWIGDGRPFPFQEGDAAVTVTVEDELGKIDLNTASVDVLERLFVAGGVGHAQARDLAGEVDLWRKPAASPDADDVRRYKDAGRAYSPRQGPFPSVDELQLVLGVNPELYARVEPVLTLWSGRAQPVAYFASSQVLEALPGMDPATVKEYVRRRDAVAPGSPLPPLPGDVTAGWQQGSSVVTIVSNARNGGVATTLKVTVRFDQLQPTREPRLPLYTILRWQDIPGE